VFLFALLPFLHALVRSWRVAPLWLVARRIPAMVHTKAPLSIDLIELRGSFYLVRFSG